jgi:cAMP and cAMP-inhibited cGMP 3',5'-cyclic phosphodiesterase 10
MFFLFRFPVGSGIAGWVAETGETLNVNDAYDDPRFNRAIDEQTGYVTKTILCMPINIRGQVIGIVQMVNKASGQFTKEDEEAFELFAIYCGLALHHAKLYDKIRRSEQKYKVALEVLSYHNSSSVDEVELILKEPIPENDETISK